MKAIQEQKEKQKKKRRLADLIRLLVLLFAMAILLYPSFSNYLYEKNSSKVISSYEDASEALQDEHKAELLREARSYNQEMLGNLELLDPFSPEKEEADARYANTLNINGAGMMGYIRIPAISVELPIYHGTAENVLQSGVGHFEGTSLPVGGESTHAVLTGHRGLPSKKLFTDMDQLEIGDVFYIKVLEETLAYEIDQILTVLPEETDALSIELGKDYVTLVTCTPYAVNTHRLLVRGHRIPYEEAVQTAADQPVEAALPFQVQMLLLAGAVLLFSLTGILLYVLFTRGRRKKNGRA